MATTTTQNRNVWIWIIAAVVILIIIGLLTDWYGLRREEASATSPATTTEAPATTTEQPSTTTTEQPATTTEPSTGQGPPPPLSLRPALARQPAATSGQRLNRIRTRRAGNRRRFLLS